MEKVMPDFKNQIERLTEIGIALSAELHLEALLEKIVRYARELSQADAGTLYLLLDGKLHFKILQNDTLQIFQGGAGAQPITFEPVLLEKNNVSAFAAIEGKTIVIGDVYECAEFDFSGPRRYDAITGYRTRSMLVVPMKNHEGAVIGVLQLINALEPETKNIIPFDADAVRLTEALASQAAIAVSNASLIKETKDLFNGLVKVLAMTIDARSHATRKHIQRVATLNILLARKKKKKKDGPFAGVNFSEKEMEAISIAGWLHDVGKITTPNWLVEKKSKLERPFDLIELIRERFAFIREQLSAAGCCKQENPQTNAQTDAAIKNLEDDLQFLCECNKPCEQMDEAALERLRGIARKTYIENGKPRPYLNEEELRALSVRRGNLTPEEIGVMRQHALWTKKILAEMPFKGHLKNVPMYAGQHHERLNGTGYPDGLAAADIPLPSRILAVADVFEALTAKDRSYKKETNLMEVFALLRRAAQNGELDSDVVELLIEDKVFERLDDV